MRIAERDEYTITKVGKWDYDVYNEVNGTRYSVSMLPGYRRCNCPHWHIRLRHSSITCKHMDMILEGRCWNEHDFGGAHFASAA